MRRAFKIGEKVRIVPDAEDWRLKPRFRQSVLTVKSVYWGGEAYSVSRFTKSGREERLYISHRNLLRPAEIKKLKEFL